MEASLLYNLGVNSKEYLAYEQDSKSIENNLEISFVSTYR